MVAMRSTECLYFKRGGTTVRDDAVSFAVSIDGGAVDMWGDGEQTRSFLYIDEGIEGVRRLMQSDFLGPVNIGSDEMISINDLALMVADIAAKKINIEHIPGP